MIVLTDPPEDAGEDIRFANQEEFAMPIPRSDDGPALDVGPIHTLVDLPCETGEGPLWHPDERALFWLDIPTGRLFRYDPVTGDNETVYQHDGEIGGMTIQQDGALLLFCTAGRIIQWRSGAVTTVIDDIPAERETRFNDVIADPTGRVYCGTMPKPDGMAALYRLDTDGSISLVYDDIAQSNGMGFTADRRTMFLTDTKFRAIYRMDYDEATGELSDRRAIIRTPPDNGAPDGMAVDAEDTIWSARWGGHGLFRYSIEGELLGQLRMPVKNVSSITFGGDDYDVAYVTTATGDERRGREIGELAGSLFAVDLGVRGKTPFRSSIDVR
jgi:D-xylono/L-arabinono-1,4-lactonase